MIDVSESRLCKLYLRIYMYIYICIYIYIYIFIFTCTLLQNVLGCSILYGILPEGSRGIVTEGYE